jgi:hypothetical protein
LSSVSKVEGTLIEVRRPKTPRWVVRDADRLARDTDEVVIQLVVAVEIFVNGDSINARWEIGINAKMLGVRGDGKKSVTECLIVVTRKSVG